MLHFWFLGTRCLQQLFFMPKMIDTYYTKPYSWQEDFTVPTGGDPSNKN